MNINQLAQALRASFLDFCFWQSISMVKPHVLGLCPIFLKKKAFLWHGLMATLHLVILGVEIWHPYIW